MPRVVLLSQIALPYPDSDTPLLRAALLSRGVDTEVIDWRAAPDSDGDLTIVRAPWDYHERHDDFLRALHRVPGRLLNPATVIEWNSHKGYLTELAGAGVPVVPTWLIRRGDSAAVPDVGGAMVIKPAVSAGALDTERFTAGDPAALEHLRSVLAVKDALVQPLLDLSRDGERSLMYFGEKFSHAVRKMPAAGDFRVQIHHGGAEFNDRPTDAELAAADRALAAVPNRDGPLLYARVDLAGPRDAPLLMELELIEPQLFLDRADHAAGQLAEAVLARLQ